MEIIFLRRGKRVDDERTTSVHNSPCVELEAVEYAAQETTTVSFMTGHGPKRNFELVQGSWLVVVGGCFSVVPVDNSAATASQPSNRKSF
jgi:hypothetical protein